jgi:hypothetical protein
MCQSIIPLTLRLSPQRSTVQLHPPSYPRIQPTATASICTRNSSLLMYHKSQRCMASQESPNGCSSKWQELFCVLRVLLHSYSNRDGTTGGIKYERVSVIGSFFWISQPNGTLKIIVGYVHYVEASQKGLVEASVLNRTAHN